MAEQKMLKKNLDNLRLNTLLSGYISLTGSTEMGWSATVLSISTPFSTLVNSLYKALTYMAITS